ncbi:MAG TPA: ABC transporter permease subunit [Ramlibacter sp.]|uniref:ABC transporter permease n=1 Tax=Ramlibacter sp. TaxID=1917967 RepID=UPI002CAB3A77|nr:ABC transporter permease subunit [Ramlibacter sp.]HVZ44985.1 ABC transporter permease subunit [Ramlibacter sp.]
MLDFDVVWSGLPALLKGAALTIKLTAAILLLGMLLALPLALAKNSKHLGLRVFAHGYIGIFRGTPSLVQVFLLYYGGGQFDLLRHSFLWPVLRDPFWCTVIALGLNSAAYTAKNLAGALAAIPPGLSEAARVLGLTRFARLWTVELPLAIRTALPAYSNEVILTCKATSLASTVTLIELTGSARLLASQTYAPYESFLAAGAGYLVINYVLMVVLRSAERAFAIA